MTTTAAAFKNQPNFAPPFATNMHSFLASQSKEWLIEQILHLTTNTTETNHQYTLEATARQRTQRVSRLQEMGLNPNHINTFVEKFYGYDRATLIREGYLCKDAPIKGTALIAPEHRTAKGEALLLQAKDILFGLLFGDTNTHTQFNRSQRELLTLTLPRAKAQVFGFLKATTELNAAGTWQDPESVSNDARADNIIFEVEYGEVAEELIGQGIVRCLSLINNLEVNEQILYARMIDVEQSTLID